MRFAHCAALLGCAVLSLQAGVANAAQTDLTQPHVLDKVTIVGNKSVPTSELTPVLHEQPGTRVTQDDIVADRDAIMKALEQKNVVGSVAVRIATEPNKHLQVSFVVNDGGVQAPIVTKVNATLHAETFTGNNLISSDKLAAASGLIPGQPVTNDKLATAQKAITDAYKAANKPYNIEVAASTTKVGTVQVDVNWTITETKVKRKRSTEPEGSRELDPSN